MEKLALGKFSVKQLDYIRKEYKFLSNSSNIDFNDTATKTKTKIKIEKAKLTTFIRTIEKIFEVDFYGDLIKKL